MSQQAGGLGGARRGPGETKLETDRRRVRSRIASLEHQIADMRTSRATQRKARRRSGLPTAALVGYTNAGKSSLLNRLTGAGVLVEDRLFSTLDATVRRLPCPRGAPSCSPTPSASCATCPTSWSRPSAPPWRRRWRPTC